MAATAHITYNLPSILFTASHGIIEAMERHSGKTVWVTALPDARGGLTTCLVDGARGYVLCGCQGTVWSLDAVTGEHRWTAKPSALRRSRTLLVSLPFTTGDVIAAGKGSVCCLAALDGKVVWTATLCDADTDVMAWVEVPPFAIPEAPRLWCATNGRLTCLDGVAGKVLWATDLHGTDLTPTPYTLLRPRKDMIMTVAASVSTSVSSETGEIQNKFSSGPDATLRPEHNVTVGATAAAVAFGLQYIATNGVLCARTCDGTTGKLTWELDIHKIALEDNPRQLSRSVASLLPVMTQWNQPLLVVGYMNWVIALHAPDKEVLWRTDVGMPESCAVLSLVADSSDKLFALGGGQAVRLALTSGNLQWKRPLDVRVGYNAVSGSLSNHMSGDMDEVGTLDTNPDPNGAPLLQAALTEEQRVMGIL